MCRIVWRLVETSDLIWDLLVQSKSDNRTTPSGSGIRRKTSCDRQRGPRHSHRKENALEKTADIIHRVSNIIDSSGDPLIEGAMRGQGGQSVPFSSPPDPRR